MTKMAYGYGPVAAATFVGFFIGLYIRYYYTRGLGIDLLGYFLLFIGIIAMLLNRKVVTGIPGGLLTGIGLGITLVATI
jgi:hypothetical protein